MLLPIYIIIEVTIIIINAIIIIIIIVIVIIQRRGAVNQRRGTFADVSICQSGQSSRCKLIGTFTDVCAEGL